MILIRFLAILPLFTSVESQVVRIGLGSCAHQDSSQGIWKAVLGWEPDIFLHLGDAIYADTRDSVEMFQIYQKAKQNVPFQEVREQIPFLVTWDDHDYGANDAGESYPMREAS